MWQNCRQYNLKLIILFIYFLLITQTDWFQAKLSKSQMQFALILLFFLASDSVWLCVDISSNFSGWVRLLLKVSLLNFFPLDTYFSVIFLQNCYCEIPSFYTEEQSNHFKKIICCSRKKKVFYLCALCYGSLEVLPVHICKNGFVPLVFKGSRWNCETNQSRV